jgi:hypothetical protein
MRKKLWLVTITLQRVMFNRPYQATVSVIVEAGTTEQAHDVVSELIGPHLAPGESVLFTLTEGPYFSEEVAPE